MIIYKPQAFLDYMSDVKKYSRDISTLNDQWENVKLLCEIECPTQSQKILPSMNNIQNNFYNLQQQLIETLITEAINRMDQKTVSKAQAAVDILIRNLYERTADVGFLATDTDIRRFVCDQGNREDGLPAIRRRLHEYVAKYSIYDEIIILDKYDTVLANLDEDNPIARKRIGDPLLRETLKTPDSFTETFRKSPLQPNKEKAHIFSSKIYAEDSNEIVGCICLCFRFANEMEGIFKKLDIDYDGSVILIVDENGSVLASSDENHVPIGIYVEPVDEAVNGIIYYRGQEYITKTLRAQGYQGYLGLGWKGQVVVPLRLAFKEKASLKGSDPDVMNGLMNQADSFSKALHEIVEKTRQINRSLKQIVYNGQILTNDNDKNAEFLKLSPLLSFIGRLGVNISGLFATSIKNLFATVITRSLEDVGFLASLCINTMDRNLYERADDCRWWALNSTFRSIMARGSITEADQGRLTEILTYIHSLYTVYSNLFIFDQSGRIVAVSNPERTGDIGTQLHDEYIHSILKNNKGEHYEVSPFAATPLYEGQHTYIYGASITDIEKQGRTVGGIGIVFDSKSQLKAMLEDFIKTKSNSFAVFTDRNGKIISSTEPSLKPGDKMKLPYDLLCLENGAKKSEILIYKGGYYAVGCCCSSSYREYKSSDGYRNDVLAFVFELLADYGAQTVTQLSTAAIDQRDIVLSENSAHKKLIVFEVRQQLFALEQSAVPEVIFADGLVELPDSGLVKGVVPYNDQFIGVVDTHMLMKQDTAEIHYLLVVKPRQGMYLALPVDELVSAVEINESDVLPIPDVGQGKSFVDGIVSIPNAGHTTVMVIDPKAMLDMLEADQLTQNWDELIRALEKRKEEALQAAVQKQPAAQVD